MTDTNWALLIGNQRRLSPTALRKTCVRCLGPCWVTPESLKAAELGKRPVKLACILCAPVLLPRGMGLEELTPGQLEELRAGGVDAATAKARIARFFSRLGRATN